MQSEHAAWLDDLSGELVSVGGVVGVVLGGSRARGAAQSDSDYDIGIYYRPEAEFDWKSVQRIARSYDDLGAPAAATAPHEWGEWMNGGAWLEVGGSRVDFLYRDVDRVERIVRDASRGHFTSNYHLGHPSAFHSYMLMSELHFNVPLCDPHGLMAELRAATIPYPPALRHEIARRFSWEANFTFVLLSKTLEREDAYYRQGLAFRFVSCLVQVLFALNERYFLNEKASVRAVEGLTLRPQRFEERVELLSSAIPSGSAQRRIWLGELDRLRQEVETLARGSGPD